MLAKLTSVQSIYMLCNTVEVFGGDMWSKIPENTWSQFCSVPPCAEVSTVSNDSKIPFSFSPIKHVQGVWRGPMGEWRWLQIIVYLAISLFLVPFCFSHDFFFKFQYVCMCLCICEKVWSHACRRPWESEEGVVSPGGGTTSSYELNTWPRH